MAVIEVPVRTDVPHSQFACELEGVTYVFDLRWNARDSAWYMSISSAEGDPILSGLKLVTSFPLGMRSRDTRKPPGMLIARDTTGQGIDVAGRSDLGAAVKLVYFESNEL